MKLVIELPPREVQIAFNRKRWAEVLNDRDALQWSGRVETDAFGNTIMMPPASGNHSFRTREVQKLMESYLGGYALPECPISTVDGIRAADVGWYSDKRFARVKGQIAFEIAPEICVEIRSPRNTDAEMSLKKQLYFEAGAEEVWFCEEDGKMAFFALAEPERRVDCSGKCPGFPGKI